MNARRPVRWVLASSNPGKLRELEAMLSRWGLELVPQRQCGIESVEETGSTFVENALLKARHAAAASRLPAIADDSGLVVDALNGAPGIRSARFAGDTADDTANVDKLLAALANVEAADRGAHFHCVIVALTTPADPAPLIACGRWDGRIAFEASGSAGFGYDPVFLDHRHGVTAAELAPSVKNRISHRAKALAALRDLLSRRER